MKPLYQNIMNVLCIIKHYINIQVTVKFIQSIILTFESMSSLFKVLYKHPSHCQVYSKYANTLNTLDSDSNVNIIR